MSNTKLPLAPWRVEAIDADPEGGAPDYAVLAADYSTVAEGVTLEVGALMAAAPELLEALREAEFVMDDCPMVSQQLTQAIRKARAAIAKATQGGAAA